MILFYAPIFLLNRRSV